MDQTATVQIEKVYPRNGNKPASLKDTAGNYFGIPDGAVGVLQPGMTGELTYWVKQGQNRQFFNATKWNGQDLPKGQAQPAPVQQQPLHPQAVVNPPAPQPAMPTQAQMNEAAKEESIFITGVVGRSMQSGQFSITDIDKLTKAARAAWLNRASGALHPEPQGDPGQSYDQELDDQIPL